ncbi:MAG: hypothetical protein KDA32_12870, partial [Phycisphaerales bacterium]|nr:hypothetical protein [Phycisphaerales bacterium]
SAARSVLYRLNDGATYQEGCFPPCRCLIADGDIRGTFVLTYVGTSGTTSNYRVADVNWWVTFGDRDIHITGGGDYRRISGVAGFLHEFELELNVDGNPQRFRGGANDFDNNFPTIDGVTISVNGLECYDIAIGIDASPVPVNEVQRYCLERPSNYQEGCLPPCLCPILASSPLTGRYGLVELRNYGTWIEYAVVDMGLRVRSSDFDPPSSTFQGVGRYIWVSGFAGVIEQMQLALSIDGGPPTAFDSGFNNDFDNEFPGRIDIRVARNGFFCYDIVLDIRSPRCRVISPLPAMSEEAGGRATPEKAPIGG